MKLIKQSFEILEQKDFSLIGIKKFIERCGRVCYKSEDKITNDSYEKFVSMLEKRDHARPLEFGTVHLKMPWVNFNNFVGFCISKAVWDSCWIKYHIDRDSEDKTIYITTNYRYYKRLKSLKPLYGYIDIEEFFTEEDNECYPKRYTVHFITSRGIMDEFRTHVSLSHLAESTRYCNYSKDKFGKELTFIKPCWLDMHDTDKGREVTRNWNFDILDGCSIIAEEGEFDDARDAFLTSLNVAEHCYLELLQKGWTPQQARNVLPLSVKSELISCGFKDAWDNFFYRRCTNDAHPMAREIAIPLLNEFKTNKYF